MEFVIDGLLSNALVPLMTLLGAAAAWWGKGFLAKRAGKKQALEKARQDDVAAAADIHRRTAGADELRDEPTLGRRD